MLDVILYTTLFIFTTALKHVRSLRRPRDHVYSLTYSVDIRKQSRGCLRNDVNFIHDQQYKTLNINFQNFI